MSRHWLRDLEDQELLTKLCNEFGADKIELLLDHQVYTKKGRLNKSAVARKLGIKNTTMVDALFVKMRELLKGSE